MTRTLSQPSAWCAAGSTCLTAAAATSRCAGAAVDKPNAVFILVDDLGPEWLSCGGWQERKSPHFDKLAAGSGTFTAGSSMGYRFPWLYVLKSEPGEKENLIRSDQADTRAALKRLTHVVKTLPKWDAGPRYEATPPQPWGRKPRSHKRKRMRQSKARTR